MLIVCSVWFVINQKGNTALHIASLAGKLDVVKFLLINGASVNARSKASIRLSLSACRLSNKSVTYRNS